MRNNAVYGLFFLGLLFIASGVGLSALQPMAIAVMRTTIYVQDQGGSPVAGATVSFDWGENGSFDFVAYTDEGGAAYATVTQGIYTIKIEKQGYLPLEKEGVDLRSSNEFGEASLVFVLEKDTQAPQPSGATCIFYFVDQEMRLRSGCWVEIGDLEAMSDQEGKAVLGNVPLGEIYAHFYGEYWISVTQKKSFDFVRSITVTESVNTYVVYIDSGTVTSGQPPEEAEAPPEPQPLEEILQGGDEDVPWWQKLPQQFFWLGLAFMVLGTVALLFQGAGTEIIRGAMR